MDRAGRQDAAIRYWDMDWIMEREAAGTPDRVETTPGETVWSGMSEAEFASIYERHYGDVYRYVLAMSRSHADAEDVSAEAFERAYRAWTSGPMTDRDKPLPWLLLTARRIFTDRWRRARRLTRLLPGLRPANSTNEHRTTEFWLWFEAVCKALPERQREVLVLRYQRDLTDADIGTIMGLTDSGVRSLVARSLASLRDHPELLR